MIGLETIPPSSSITIGFVMVPSFSSLASQRGKSPAFRQVACRARQARCGATDEFDETVEIEETDEDRDERELSVIIDSGLDPKESMLIVEGRRVNGKRISMFGGA